MTKIDPEKLGRLGEDLARVEKDHQEVLHIERGIAENLAKVRREVEEKYAQVGEKDAHLGGSSA